MVQPATENKNTCRHSTVPPLCGAACSHHSTVTPLHGATCKVTQPHLSSQYSYTSVWCNLQGNTTTPVITVQLYLCVVQPAVITVQLHLCVVQPAREHNHTCHHSTVTPLCGATGSHSTVTPLHGATGNGKQAHLSSQYSYTSVWCNLQSSQYSYTSV